MVAVEVHLLDNGGEVKKVQLMVGVLSNEQEQSIKDDGHLELTNRQLGTILQRNKEIQDKSRITE